MAPHSRHFVPVILPASKYSTNFETLVWLANETHPNFSKPNFSTIMPLRLVRAKDRANSVHSDSPDVVS